MSDAEKFNTERVAFLGEQDGEVERELKAKLNEQLARFPNVQRAYLAVVRYGIEEEPSVALCIFNSTADPEIVRACGTCFHEMFNPNEHLDILFIDEHQVQQLSQVCEPFFRVEH